MIKGKIEYKELGGEKKKMDKNTKNSTHRSQLITLLFAAIILLGVSQAVSAYQSPPATYIWDASVPNYNAAATINSGTIGTSNLVFGDFLGVSATQPNAPGFGDSGAIVGWDDTWTGGGDANTNGDHLDGKWAQIILPAEGWWDLG